MAGHHLTKEQIAAFGQHLRLEEQNPSTIEKYPRTMRAFAGWPENRSVAKEMAASCAGSCKRTPGSKKTVPGEIFLTRNGKGLSRRQIWAKMKVVCKQSGVAPSKGFPHDLRHLFARAF